MPPCRRPRAFTARSWGLPIILALSSPSVTFAQATPAVASKDSADVLVLDHEFTGPVEFVRVFLQGRQVYRAELSTSDVTLELRTPIQGVRLPRVYPVFAPAGSGSSVVEVYTEEDGEFELRPIDLSRGGVSTHLRLFRDVGESRRRMALIDRPGSAIGVEVAGGRHSGYAHSTDATTVEQGGEVGGVLELCFAARAPGASRFSICALGLGHESQHGAPTIFWAFTEPRLRVLGNPASGSPWDMGVLFRVGLGSIARANEGPVQLAPGVYATRRLGRRTDGAGWSVQASYTHAWYRGFAKPYRYDPATGAPTRGAPASPTSGRLLLGLGWYQ